MKTKTVVRLDSLEEFLREFDPDSMIDALMHLCDLATSHPELDDDAAAACIVVDDATDLLMRFFIWPYTACRNDGDTTRVVLDSAHGTIELLKPGIRRQSREPSVVAPSSPVRPRLLQRRHASN